MITKLKAYVNIATPPSFIRRGALAVLAIYTVGASEYPRFLKREKMRKEYNKLKRASINYHGALHELENVISDKVEFEFSIFEQASDGFVILNEEAASNAPLADCLEVIRKKGVLSEDDFNELAI